MEGVCTTQMYRNEKCECTLALQRCVKIDELVIGMIMIVPFAIVQSRIIATL
jgi:hypothetical protein